MAADQGVRSFYEKVCAEALPKTPLFGTSLDKYMELQKKTLPFMNEPWIVRKCCDYLRDNGLKTEGIFRVPGSTSMIKKISDAFDAGQNPDFVTLGSFVEDVAGVLKKYLRDLPEPLLSDGTADDPLQKALLEITIKLEDEDVTESSLQNISRLLKQLPRYRKAVVTDLFHLFACITSHASFNLMNPDNVATIFGGMTNIMTSNSWAGSQRSRIVRILIENFQVAFDGLYEFDPKPEEAPGAKETKEGIKVYLHDGTFKSLFCQSSEPAKEIQKKAISKVQQTTDIDASAYFLYEIRDSIWRKIGENEKILPIIKSGSALLLTDRLKGERSEKPNPIIPTDAPPSPNLPTSPSPQLSLANTTIAPSVKTKGSKSKKSPRMSEAPTPTLALNSLQLPKENASALAKPSPRETNTPPLPFGVPLQMLLWIFPSIPLGSTKATEWDANTTLEGTIELKCAPTGSVITAIAGDLNRKHTPIQMAPVDDSTRYFILTTSPTQRLGLGFETRDEAVKFKSLVQQMLQYDQIHAINADTSSQAGSVGQFALGPIGFSERMEDGFYDIGTISPNGQIPSLKDLQSSALDLKSSEVILVNKDQDVRLDRIVQVANKLVLPSSDLESRTKSLALYVSSVFGGIDISDGVGSLEDESYASLEGFSRDAILSLRTRTKSNIVKLGNVTHGVRRHRAILFKYIADRLDPVLPSALARTMPTAPGKLPSYAILIPHPTSADAFCYVDLVNEPGFSYPYDSPVTSAFSTHLYGKLPTPDAPFIRSMFLAHPDVDHDLSFGNKIGRLPVVSDDRSIRIYEQIGASHTSAVYRASLGGVQVAIKETSCSGDELASLASSLAGLQHPNIVPHYGFDSHSGRARFITQYFGLGSLQDQLRLIRTKAVPYDDNVIWQLLNKIVAGLQYLHSQDKIHGNLSTSNIMLDGDARVLNFSTVKLADALVSASRSTLTAHHDNYRAPEVQGDAGLAMISKPADIWSLGAVAAELVLEQSLTHDELVEAMNNRKDELGAFITIITECCNKDAAARPEIDKLAIAISEALSAVSPPPSGRIE